MSEDPTADFEGLHPDEMIGYADSEDRTGKLSFEIKGDELLLAWGRGKAASSRTEMMRFSPSKNLLRIFPRSIRSNRLEHQFSQLREIQLDNPEWNPYHHSETSDRYGLLYAAGLPSGFHAIYTYGLGIGKHYKGFVTRIEENTDATVLRFITAGNEGLSKDGTTFRVRLERFEKYRATVERNRGRGRVAASRVNDAESQNVVADLLSLPTTAVKYGRNETIRKMTEEVATGHVITVEDREALVATVSAEARRVAREAPLRLGQLRSDIEFVTLETLIEQFERDLEGGFSKDEPHWQDFFDNNRFALQQLFSMPIVVEQPQAHVQGADLSGKGARIVDFLCANVVTGSVVVVEIKTPGAQLMERDPYRGRSTAAVHAVHPSLSGAIAQLQSQMIAVPQNMPLQLSRTPSAHGLDPWHDIRGAIIVGKVSSLSSEQQESFLRYRSAFSNITILGYDEVLARLRGLHAILQKPES